MTRHLQSTPTRTSRSPIRRVAALAALVVPFVGLAAAQPADAKATPVPGELDTSFGNGGKAAYRV